MEFDAVLLAPRRAAMVAQGYWLDRTINDALDACVAACPDKTALTAVQVESGEVTRLSYRELATLADRVGVGLARLGVARNDVVSVQLPNGWPFVVLFLACARIGAVMNPLMHIFRERELSFMLAHGEAKVIVAPKTFRGFDFERMLLAQGRRGRWRRRQQLRGAARGPGLGARSRRRAHPGRESARPGRRHAAHLHLGHHRRAERRHAFGEHVVLQYRALRGTHAPVER